MRMKAQISVLVVDEQPLVAEAVAGALGEEPDLRVLGPSPRSGLDALEQTLADKPDIVLLDYWMPDIEGPAVVRLIRAREPERKIILTSWFHSDPEVIAALQAGAAGFFPKSMGVDEVAEGIRRAHLSEGPVLPKELKAKFRSVPSTSAKVTDAWGRLAGLTPRQIDVIGLIAQDLSSAQLSEALSITPATIKVHIRNILAKTASSSQREVIALARSVGLIRN